MKTNDQQHKNGKNWKKHLSLEEFKL